MGTSVIKLSPVHVFSLLSLIVLQGSVESNPRGSWTTVWKTLQCFLYSFLPHFLLHSAVACMTTISISGIVRASYSPCYWPGFASRHFAAVIQCSSSDSLCNTAPDGVDGVVSPEEWPDFTIWSNSGHCFWIRLLDLCCALSQELNWYHQWIKISTVSLCWQLHKILPKRSPHHHWQTCRALLLLSLAAPVTTSSTSVSQIGCLKQIHQLISWTCHFPAKKLETHSKIQIFFLLWYVFVGVSLSIFGVVKLEIWRRQIENQLLSQWSNFL